MCKADSRGLLKRSPVTASAFHLIGKETERGWEQAGDISTLLPALIRYKKATNAAKQLLQERLLQVPLDILKRETGLSRHTYHSRTRRKARACTVASDSYKSGSPLPRLDVSSITC